MAAGLRSGEDGRERPSDTTPPITACRSCPGTLVFIEADNSDAWIATDVAVEPRE